MLIGDCSRRPSRILFAILACMVLVSPSLLALRDQYVGLLKGRAKALRDAAATKEDGQQKQALKNFQDHASQVGGVIDGINQFCASEALE